MQTRCIHTGLTHRWIQGISRTNTTDTLAPGKEAQDPPCRGVSHPGNKWGGGGRSEGYRSFPHSNSQRSAKTTSTMCITCCIFSLTFPHVSYWASQLQNPPSQASFIPYLAPKDETELSFPYNVSHKSIRKGSYHIQGDHGSPKWSSWPLLLKDSMTEWGFKSRSPQALSPLRYIWSLTWAIPSVFVHRVSLQDRLCWARWTKAAIHSKAASYSHVCLCCKGPRNNGQGILDLSLLQPSIENTLLLRSDLL